MEAARPSQLKDEPRPPLPLCAWISVWAALLAGATLRAWMLHKFFEVNGDSRLYGGMAKNVLLFGRYALTDNSGVLHATLIRLPGYPLFLAACFRLFGMENYFSASCVQIALELFACWLLFRFVYRITPAPYALSAGQATLWLSALCPFTAIYDAEPLTEALSIFCVALALYALARFQVQPDWIAALAFTVAVACAALLRPDGALVGVAFVPPVAAQVARVFHRTPHQRKSLLRMSAICLLLAITPFALWSGRNWRVFHVFEPLAPRYATDPGEDIWPGWQRWMKTWCLDFVSTYEVYWNVPGDHLDLSALPTRAFDSPAEYAETAGLAAGYESNGEELSPELDAGFARLAAQRIAAHPLRYYLWLPFGRVADMWLRPRVENLPIDRDWWVYRHHHVETRFSWFYAGLNAFYLLLACFGLCLRPRFWPWLFACLLLRSALLATIEAPEARYTIECFPMLFALGGTAIGWVLHRFSRRVT